ncbi:MAG TPA: nickel pincer cofactor biosynthesis protein LarB [Methanoculleus sp.]|uniref:nickel pincer cofactor biosynthesis protein LarB n=1 Tax=Methanoculleus sp. TaxID=90427 RepID=UPI002CEAAA25|nr:nickel pincer cofactor biosynthesis protein LarB [Methanoculleus sp.]HNT07952.1 nickel pincer cofactor biosynthesis protein LarB [Methanoculleus sp.]HOS67467.1 nickel pincer cofactor biosynthesis protein LarB [Methanoculleus sp.]
MLPNATIREILRMYRSGEVSEDEAAAAIEGLRIDVLDGMARIDAGRSVRCGMPEVVLAEGKDPLTFAEIMLAQVKAAGRCIATRVSPAHIEALRSRLPSDIRMEHREAARAVILSTGNGPDPRGGTVAILTAGTSDIPVAEEARLIAEEMGCDVRTAYDVGVAGIHRLFSALKDLIPADVFIVAAGREGTLPAIVAGLVDRPVIGVPVSTGYGYMGGGEAALASMLQACSVLAVVNIDAGFTAGAFAAQVAHGGGRR